MRQGSVRLEDVEFPVDPHSYQLPIHDAVGAKLRLRTGEQQLDKEMVSKLFSLYAYDRSSGGYTFTDWLGNEVKVFIGGFRPRPSNSGTFTYDMELVVMRAQRVLGSPVN